MDDISKVTMRKDQSKVYVSWDAIKGKLNSFSKVFNYQKYDKVYGIPRGGTIISVMLSHILNIPIIVDQWQITKKTLIVDDICDSGKTLEGISARFPDCDTYTLYYKREATIKPKHYGSVAANNQWVVFPWEIDTEE